MIIPVRVAYDAAVTVTTRGRTVEAGHPLYTVECPVCDEPLGGRPCSLVYVGVAPEDRKTAGYMTGAAVAVHDSCTAARS